MDQLTSNIEDISLTPLQIIKGEFGDVMHALKRSDPNYGGFGEAYFSTVQFGKIKGWKQHSQMVLNLVVPIGEIKFVIYDDRSDSPSKNEFFVITLSPQNYYRLTIPPKLWMGFQGISKSLNMLLNLANIPHNPNENISCKLDKIPYSW